MSTRTTVPTLTTQRLVLRGHRTEDFADSAAMWADPQVTRFIGGKPLSPEDVWKKILQYAGHWSLMGFGYWVIDEKATGRFVGEAGFADFKRDIEPSLAGAPEVGWALASWAHGKGFATEAVRAALDWGRLHFGSVRTVCLIHPENLQSIRLAEKCGYRHSQLATYKGQPVQIFEQP
jgi:RimJ/RimL family protein N-acetyltransferase